MSLFYSLKNPVSLEKIMQDINNLCGKLPQSEYKNTAIVISLQKIYESSTNPIPKIEHISNG